MVTEISRDIFRKLYEEWVAAIAGKDYAWFERHLAPNFSATAHVWPNLRLDKEQFIELDKQIVEIEAEWQTVDILPVGDLVVTVATLRMYREVFRTDTAVAGPGDGQDDLASLTSGSVVTGKLCTYTGAWKWQSGVWQILDHRMIDAVD